MTGPGPGLRACYLQGCQHPECLAAHVGYLANRRRQIAYGRWEPFADAEAARIHVKNLQAAGVSWQQVARLAGVHYWVVRSLLYGHARGQSPSRRLRRENADRILAVRVPEVRLNDCGLADATGTRRRLQALMAQGWTQAALAAELGTCPGNVAGFLAAAQVQEVTALRVRAMYGRLGRPQMATHQGRAASERTRRMAERNGWPPPAAWDDDVIDDPDAGPAAGWGRLRRLPGADVADEAADLFGLGYDRPQAAERLGMTRSALDAALARERRRRPAMTAPTEEVR